MKIYCESGEQVLKNNKKVNFFIFFLYMLCVWSIYLFVNYYDMLKNLQESKMLFIWLFILCFVIVLPISMAMFMCVMKIPSIKCRMHLSKKKKCYIFAMFFSICLVILFIYYLAYYPGAFSPDSLGQWGQVSEGKYNDWHPVWHTILFFAIPLKLTEDYSLIVVFQIIYFSLILGYMVVCIAENSNMWASIAAFCFIVLNPYTGCIVMYPWKDVAFGITSLWAMVITYNIYVSKGEWVKKGRIMLLAFVLVNVTLFRHNGILLSGMMLVALLFEMDRKKWRFLLLLLILLLFLVKGVLYSSLGVEKPGQRRMEMVGLPLTIIANVTKECPDRLDEEMKNFVYQMASQKDWEAKYICGDFNSIKWQGDVFSAEIIEKTSTMNILKMTARCFQIAPMESFKALFMLTDLVYSIEGDLEYDAKPETAVTYNGNQVITTFLQCYKEIFRNTILKYGGSVGVSILIMVAVILGRSDLRSWKDWKRIFICLPIFTYDFGTMLLLTGADLRFFYVTFLLCPLIILILLQDNEREEMINV